MNTDWNRRRLGIGFAGVALGLPGLGRAGPAGPAYAPPETLNAALDLFARMTVPVGLGGQGPFPFVVDTGANQSVISADLAQRLGLQPGPPNLLHGAAGAQVVQTVVAPAMQIGGRVESNVTLSVLPGGPMAAPGLLGVDRLGGERLTLDFAHAQVIIEPTPRFPKEDGAYVIKARRRAGPLTLVRAWLGKRPITCFIDTGADRTIGDLALREVVGPDPLRFTAGHIVSATGQTVETEIGLAPSLTLGGLRLTNVPVAFADLHTFRLWGLTPEPALLLGVDILSRFSSVTLDFGRSEVRFRPPSPI